MTSFDNILSSLEGREMGIDHPIRFAHRMYSSESLVRRFQITKRLDFHDGCVNALSFNRSGSLLLSGSDDLKVCVWDWVNQKPACYFDSRHKANVLQCRFMPFANDCMIVTSGLDGQVRLTELGNSGVFHSSRRILKHTGSCHKIIMNDHNPQCVLSCGEDAHIRLVDLRSPSQTLRSIVVVNEGRHAVPLYSIAVRPLHPTEFAACGMDRWLRIFDYRFTKPSCGTLVRKFCPNLQNSSNPSEIYSHITSVAYSRNGEELVASYHKNKIFLFDANNSNEEVNPLHSYKGHCNVDTVKGVNFYGSESEYVISGSDCGHLFIWKKDTEKIIWYAKAEESGPLNIAEPHPAYPLIATSGFDYCAKIWEPTRTEAVPLDKIESVIEQNHTRDFNLSDDADLLLRVLRPFRNRHSRHARTSQAMIIPMATNDRSIRIPLEFNDEVVELITSIGELSSMLDVTSSSNSTDESGTNYNPNQILNDLAGNEENSENSSWEDFGSTDVDRFVRHRTGRSYVRMDRHTTRSIIRPRRHRSRGTPFDQVARGSIVRMRGIFPPGTNVIEIPRSLLGNVTLNSESSGQARGDSPVENRIYSFDSNNGLVTDSDLSIAFSSSPTNSSSEHSADDAMDTD